MAEGGGDAAEIRSASARGLGIQGSGEEFVLDSPDTAEAPVGRGHFLNHAALDTVGGSEALEVLGAEGVKALGRFSGEHDGVGEEAVLEGVLG